jgi:CRISPR-associated protein Cas2
MSRWWVVSYDIVDDGRRQRIAKILEAYSRRVQWSVFECHLTSEDREVLQSRLRAEIDLETDSIRWYPLCGWCRDRVIGQGTGGLSEAPSYFVI